MLSTIFFKIANTLHYSDKPLLVTISYIKIYLVVQLLKFTQKILLKNQLIFIHLRHWQNRNTDFWSWGCLISLPCFNRRGRLTSKTCWGEGCNILVTKPGLLTWTPSSLPHYLYKLFGSFGAQNIIYRIPAS